MSQSKEIIILVSKYITGDDHSANDYFTLIKELVSRRKSHEKETVEYQFWQKQIDKTYGLIRDEIMQNKSGPTSPVKFGTSGWRGILGKDLNVRTVSQVTRAIVEIFQEVENDPLLAEAIGVHSFEEAKNRGCIVGHDNRFGGEILARAACDVLTGSGIQVHYAGETTTGAVSASLLERGAAFSINLTPSHNPMEYGGYKFNGSDGGPASSIVTDRITLRAREIINSGEELSIAPDRSLVSELDSLSTWITMVRKNKPLHGLDYDDIMERFANNGEVCLAVDCVHGASRKHIRRLISGGEGEMQQARLHILRGEADTTFGGVAPEPTPANMVPVREFLASRPEPLKLGAIIDPDGDRIRLTDSTVEIDMNLFGAMTYDFLHEYKGLKGSVAKTVATSNFANQLAKDFCEEIFESKVGFKEFKPVVGKALVCFEESDGISVIGHTPEKDAYIGLLLALDMVLTMRMNLGEYLARIQEKHGYYFPARDGVAVSSQGEDLLEVLSGLDKYSEGTVIRVGNDERTITDVITIDGRKMVLDDGSWLMIRPSGTEPKVRFYVEARDRKKQDALFETARGMLAEIGLL